MRDLNGSPLPHFTPFPTPASSGVNVFAQNLHKSLAFLARPYVFPPPVLVGPLLRFLLFEKRDCTFVTLVTYWWPTLKRYATRSLRLAQTGEHNVLLIPSRHGFVPQQAIPGELWAFSLTFAEEAQ